MRTLGLYQPFASLMFHGKIETRWVKEDKKPPFVEGEYLIYSTIRFFNPYELFNMCGPDIVHNIQRTLEGDISRFRNKTALGIGRLIDVRLMRPDDEQMAFVKYKGWKVETIDGIAVTKRQWCLIFEEVKRINEFEWKFGKQGVGKVPESELSKIIINP